MFLPGKLSHHLGHHLCHWISMDPRKHISYVMAVIAARDFQSVFLCLFLFGPPIRWCFASTGLPQNRQYSLYSVIIPFSYFTCASSSLDGIISLHDFWYWVKPRFSNPIPGLYSFYLVSKQPVLSSMFLNGRYYLYLFLRSSAIIADTSFSRIQKAATFAAFIPLPHLHACQMLQVWK